MNIECFTDGICPKCGGHTYAYRFADPMVCSKCGWMGVTVEEEDKKAIENLLRKEEEKC